MSKPNSYLPDPKGWIETASISRSRKPSQRPLTSFSHGLATPPTSSGFKRNAASNAVAGPGPSSALAASRFRNIDDTPVPSKQSSLRGFFTPPTTGLNKAAARGNVKPGRFGQQEARTPLSQKFGSQPKAVLRSRLGKEEGQGSKLKVHKDTEDFWGSGTDEDGDEVAVIPSSSNRDTTKSQVGAERRKAGAPTRTRSLLRSSSSEIIDHALEDNDDDTDGPAHHLRSAKKPRIRTSSPETSPPLFDRPAHTPSPIKATDPPSSVRPTTPVPDYVLDIHRQLCGQDSAQTKRVKSPWKKRELPAKPAPAAAKGASISPNTRKRKRGNPTTREQVDRRVWEKAHENRRKTLDQKSTKHLVDLSSSSNPPSDDVEKRVWNIVHGKSAEKGKALVNLSSSDPPTDEVRSPTINKGKRGPLGPLSPLSTNRLPKRNPSLNQQMSTQASPVARLATPSRRQTGKVISPLPRTSGLQRSPGPSNVSPPSSFSLSSIRQRPPSPPPASFDDKIINIVNQARENEAKLEEALLAVCDPTTSQAYSQRHSTRNQKFRPVAPETASIPPTHHPTSPEQLLFTPRKKSPFLHAHHKLTPPRSGSKSIFNSPMPHQMSQPPMVHRQQILFVIPDPPRQPDFSPQIPSSASRRTEWKAVDMEPETLVTWSMGGGESLAPAQEVQKSPARPLDDHLGNADAFDLESQESQDAPLFGEDERDSAPATPPRRLSLASRSSSSKSIEPTIFSQNFPVLVPTSPVRQRSSQFDRSKGQLRPWSRAAEREELARLATSSPRAGPSDVPAASQVKFRSGWDHLARGVLAGTPPSETTPRAVASSQSRKPKAANSQRTRAASQSKLAAFGFFGDRELTEKGKERKHDFEKSWEDEEDIEFAPSDEERDEGLGAELTGSAKTRSKRLGKVPQAPYHPHLRSAGIRELERRAALTKANNPSSHKEEANPFLEMVGEEEEDDQPLFGEHHRSDTTSAEGSGGSSQTSVSADGGVKTPKEVRDWWDALGDRRTSEFGTLD